MNLLIMMLAAQIHFSLPAVAATDFVAPPNLIGFSSGFAFANPEYSKPDSISLYQQFGTHTLRIPGGTIGNCYHYRTSAVNAAIPKGYGFRGGENPICTGFTHSMPNSSFSSNVMNAMISQVMNNVGNQKVIYVANVYNGINAEYEAILKLFFSRGVKLQGVELGNELYFGAWKYNFLTNPKGIKDVADYISRAHAAAVWFKGQVIYPGLKVSFVTPGNFDDPSMGNPAWKDAWIAAMVAEAKAYPQLYDAYTVHGYFDAPAPLPSCGIANVEQCAKDAYAAVSIFKNDTISTMRKYFTDKRFVNGVLVDTYTYPTRLEAWLTEFNMNADSNTSNVSAIINTQAHGCVTAEFAIGMIQNSDWATLTHYHSYASPGTGSGLLFPNKNSLNSNMNNSPSITASVSYYALKFAAKALPYSSLVLASTSPEWNNISISNPMSSVMTKNTANEHKKLLFANCSGLPNTVTTLNGLKMTEYSGVRAAALHYSGSVPLEETVKKTFLDELTQLSLTQIVIPPNSYGVIDLL